MKSPKAPAQLVLCGNTSTAHAVPACMQVPRGQSSEHITILQARGSVLAAPSARSYLRLVAGTRAAGRALPGVWKLCCNIECGIERASPYLYADPSPIPHSCYFNLMLLTMTRRSRLLAGRTGCASMLHPCGPSLEQRLP